MDYKATLNLPQTDFPMKANLTQREPEWVKLWAKEDLYAQILKWRQNAPKYVLHDGPPYANGDIHMGHALNKILKDIILKFKTMQGFYAPYVPGWDCHGLPVEHALFKELGKTKDEVDQLEFRKKAYRYAMKYVEIQKEQFKRLGILGDWEHPYLTLNADYEAEIIQSFITLYRKGYIYKGLKPIHWCFVCETALAEAEVEYDTHEAPSIYVAFPVKESQSLFPKVSNLSAVIWTTTPWTLPANRAIAVHPQAIYVAVQADGKFYLLAKDCLEPVTQVAGWEKVQILGECQGKELEGLKASHPFLERESPFILGDHVTLDTGTGCVHTAPGHGEEDFEVGLKYGLEVYSPVDHKGCFDKTFPLFFGKQVFEANEPICALLKEKKHLVFKSSTEHSYPHCWRCHEPVIFRATHQWFISMQKHDLRKKTLEQIKQVKWIPKAGENRIGSMVEQRPDWCLSRQRLWGVPIPVFYCQDCQEPLLNEAIGQRIVDIVRKKGSDAWFSEKPEAFIQNGTSCQKCKGTVFVKETDIIDVWFDSGVSHRAVLEHRPDLAYPASLYLEGSDQHRGWFQTALLTAVGLTHQAPYKEVLTHGFVVDGEGKKMSKSLGNIISPEEVMKKYGVDILRLWVSSVDYSSDVRLSQEVLEQSAEAYRKIRNTFKFMLGNLFDLQKKEVPLDQLPELDRWALSRLAHLTQRVHRHFEAFEFYRGYQLIHQFCIVEMSSFYFDILKDRLYTCSKDAFERRASQTVLAQILVVLTKLLAPILVFTTDEVWKIMPQHLRSAASVHLADWPKEHVEWNEASIEEKWGKLFKVRVEALKALEEARKNKKIGNPLEAQVLIYSEKETLFLKENITLLTTIFIVSQARVVDQKPEQAFQGADGLWIQVEKAEGTKCSRCWKYRTSVGQDAVHLSLCSDCVQVIGQK